MTSYTIYYQIKKNGITKREGIDAKDLKSAKHKIETKLAKAENKNKPASKQVKAVRIEILDYSVIGYY